MTSQPSPRTARLVPARKPKAERAGIQAAGSKTIPPGGFDLFAHDERKRDDTAASLFLVCVFAMYPLAGAVTIVLAGLLLAGAGYAA